MYITCENEETASNIIAVLLKNDQKAIDRYGPDFGNSKISIMVALAMREDNERALRREIAQITGATIHN
jgi:hypothetical protein